MLINKKETYTTPKALNEKTISTTGSIYASKILNKNLEIESNYVYDSSSTLIEMWKQPHPLIHTWLVLSSVSICFLSALLFIIH